MKSNIGKFLVLKGVVLCLLIHSFSSYAQESNSEEAQWIWQEESGPANTWVAFRKTINVSEVPSEAMTRISTDTKYWLWINGELALFEGGLTRGAGPNTIYYDEVDFAPYLKSGENTIAILVWYVGRTCKPHVSSGQGGLYVAADWMPDLISNTSWKMKVHPAYDPNSGGGGNGPNTLPSYNVKFDARDALGDWSDHAWYTSEYDDSNWGTPIEKGEVNSLPWGDFVKRPIPQWNDRGLAKYESLTVNDTSIQLPYTNSTGSIVTIKAKLPFNQQITPCLAVNSGEGKTITIDVDNPFNKIKATYITKNGTQQFESYVWTNGHHVIYTIPSGVEVTELKYRWTGIGDMSGNFECSDPFYTRLYWMGRNTLYVCARDGYMDCPDRERGLWIGDVADQTGAIFYTLDEGGRSLLKKAIDNTINYRFGDTLAGLAPGFRGEGAVNNELTAQSLQFIGQGIWGYYFNTGDKATLANAYPAVFNYLNLWSMQSNGMPEHRKGFANWVDWGIDSDAYSLNVTTYYMALKAAKKMAIELGHSADTAWYNDRISSIKENFDQVYWQGTHYGSTGKPIDERASAVATIEGLANEKYFDTMVEEVLFPIQKCSPHLEWMVEEALFLAGDGEKALERMKQRYGWQMENNPEITTLYERFPNDPKGNLGTYNHAWNAPNYVLSRYIAGIKPTEVAWSRFEVKPNLLHLSQVKQIVPSVKGNIILEVNKDQSSYRLDLTSPDQTKATIYIPYPDKSTSQVVVNGKIVWKKGGIKSGLAGLKMIKSDESNLCFEVEPGEWCFETSNF
ncbi:alpha-L-rhamnosidase-related protein [Reichenbachiella ulvae]|uniref:Alpha-L-rhamnosidase n=1 Tax=Reichenbachiella ulvae TaxID=2980104 RepID=A0ABT3CSN4_9BACT|nr:alpha-L-rhamnosidase C-terminal domain-containing protein [Reichenbachiella ulvae]MCV9386654.1 hypothetical protein [Reichenbachiella ulvae]